MTKGKKDHKYNTRSKSNKNIKDNYSKNESSSDEEEEYDEEDFDYDKYMKLLNDIFPSKYLKNKIIKNKKDSVNKSKSKTKAKNKFKNKSKEKNKKKQESETEEEETEEETEEEETEEEETEEETEEESEEESEEELSNNKFNIVFTIGDPNFEIEEKYANFEDEDEDEDSDSDYSTEEEEEEDDDKNKKEDKKKETLNDQEVFNKFNDMVKNLPEKDKENEVMKSIIKDIKLKEKEFNKKIKKKTIKERTKNTNKLRKLLNEKKNLNDLKFFKDNLSIEKQELVLKQVKEIMDYGEIDKPYRLALLDSDIPIDMKSLAYKKINSLKYLEQGAGEYHKIKNWIDTFMKIPFGKYHDIPLTIKDGVEKCHDFMGNAKKILDKAVYGLDDAKLQIMQMIGQWIANPKSIGTSIAIKGPMGTGKTTLVKEGISNILDRDFAFIALGGATDSSFLEGHSYTYEGSTWGKIVEILVKSKSMNPIIYFDELDKVSETPKGEEIIGILTHLTDSTQNSKFHDKYFSELEFDLSRCMFIFSYNDETKINPILKDRMYRIQTKGYAVKEKTVIAKNYLIPDIQKQVSFNKEDIVISNDIIRYIIDKYTDKEDGVRNLKRCLEVIHTKLNLCRLMKPEENIFKKDMDINIKFPITLDNSIIDKLIKKEEPQNWHNMYM